MRIKIEKANNKAKCRGLKCKKLPEFINRKGRIRKDTSCAVVSIASAGGGATAFYCRDCIDQIYMDMKMALDPKLWIFK